MEPRLARYVPVFVLVIALFAIFPLGFRAATPADTQAPPTSSPPTPAPATQGTVKPSAPARPQTRTHSVRVPVEPRQILVDDGDTLQIKWKEGDVEDVRILGIDCPETRHLQHDIPFSQSFGEEARAFALGTFASASNVELLRASTVDPFGRSLGYVFVNGQNYSLMVLGARLAEESITAFGDNGFAKEAALILAASKQAGPMAFEPPFQYRNRMRRLSNWMKSQGTYPAQ